MSHLVQGEIMRTIRPLAALLAVALASSLWLAAPAAAQESVSELPAVTNFTAARFDMLLTIETPDTTQVAYGRGSAILPDRSEVTLTLPQLNQTISAVQVGSTFYVNAGSGWERADDLPFGNLQSQAVSEQIARLEEVANGIVRVGEAQVRGTPVTHYQIWVSGEDILALGGEAFGELGDDVSDLITASTYKYDLWIGQDGRLYQQNTVAIVPEQMVEGTTIPATTTSTLLTYYDFESPEITIAAPIQ
jgi:hypothetical protein